MRLNISCKSWWRLATALAFAAIASTAFAQSLPHNIPDFSQDPSRSTVRSAGSGSWSSAGTWQSGAVPTANHVVHVDPGHVVTIDSQDAVAYTLAVHGTLRFAPAVDTRLRVTNLMIMGDHGMASMTTVGRVEIGTAASPIAADRVAEIVIANTPTGGGVADPEQFGTGIINFGKLTIHGSTRRPTFVRVATEPRAGHTTLTLTEAATGWRAGDRLVLPDTRHMKESEVTGSGWINAQNQWEEFNVQSISADGRTITLNRALTFDHLGARDLNGVLDFLPHVGNLSRNVTLRSESATGTRGHFISVHSADTDIRYARFLDLGRTTFKPLNTTTNVIGRYPIHMHHNRGPAPTPANGYQFTLIGNAVDGGSAATQFKWGIAIHNSHYGLIQDNVVYNYNGASIATEDGSESFNVFDHNFALRGMGEPNNAVSEARMAMGTEGVGFWFRGPNNYIRNNVAANFQNSTTEAAYGYVYQFIRLGNVPMPNFKGADPAVAGQFTSRNGNNMPILQFDNNEVYGATQGGFTYWWVSSQDPQPYANAQESLIKDLKIWHIYNKAVYHYPSQKITFDGLKIRGKHDAAARCCGNGIYGADYSTKAVIVRNSDIQGMDEGIQFPEAGFGPEPNLTVDNTFLRNDSNIQIPTNGSVNGCWMQNKLVVIRNSRFEAPPGRTLRSIAMVRDVGYAPECLSKLDEARVYAFNGVATDNFQIYHSNTSVLPRPPASCSPTTRAGIDGLLCPIAAEDPGNPTPAAPTASFAANPTAITTGNSTTLTWSTSNASSVSINQGVGTVNASGSVSVSPSATTTYTLTATGAGGTVTSSATVSVTTTPAGGHTKARANGYDDAWQDDWVANAKTILAGGTGQVPGLVLWIGDSLTRDPALGTWAQSGAGKTAEDQAITNWMHAGQSPQGIDSIDGFALATPYICSARSFTVGDGLGSWHFMGSSMPTDTNPTTAKQKLLNCSSYPNALNLRTMLAALPKAQFAIPEVNLDAASPGSFPDFQAMVDLMIANHIVPIIITYTYRTDAAFNQLVDQYNAALVNYARTRKLPLIDLNAEMLARLPFSQWPGRFLSDGVHYTRGNATYPAASDPYAGGDPATHSTGLALTYNGYGLKGWLGVQKMKEIKALVVDAIAPSLPTATLTASPLSIVAGQTTALSWTSSGATSVTISPGVGTVASSGSQTLSPVSTTTYTLSATNSDGTTTSTVTVNVTAAPPPPQPPTVTLAGNPASITAGSAATLSWSSTNATSVSINQGIGTVAASGSRSVSPSATTTYTVTAQGASTSATATATITVTQPPPSLPTASLTAGASTISAGDSTTLTWSTTGAATISIAPGIGAVAAAGSITVSPSTATTYVLSATNSAGSVTASATVLVSQTPVGDAFGSIGLTSGWASFGQVIPEGVATQGVSVGGLLTQTDVKNRWPDGSIRFAIISVNAPSDGSLPLHAANAATGTFVPAPVPAAVSLSISGTTYTATLPAAESSDAWLSGPVVREDRHVVVPITSAGVPHPFLRVNFDRRRYRDGEARIDVSVENMLDTSGATTVTYDVAITVNGQAVYSRAAVQHYYLTRWRKVFGTAAFDASAITPDLAPYYEARALPPYLPLVSNVVSAPSGSAFEILQPGALIANMPDHGGRPELAPYPDWTARYLVHRDLTQRSFVLANGDLSGSWPIHVRETGSRPGVGTERYVSLDQRPTVWLDGRAQSSGADYIRGLPLPIREYTTTTPAAGQSPLIPDNAHQPSLAYVPYLLTGDRYYAEEMAFWANYSLLRTANGDGVRGAAGILQSNEVRGFGWALRNMVDAAAYYPESSPMKAYLSTKVANNLSWLDAYAASQDPVTNPFTVMWLDKRPEGPQYRGLWEENYLAYAIDRAFQQGFTGGLVHRDAIAKFQLLLFTSAPDYPRSAAAPNVVGVGVPSGSGFIFHRSMAEIWNATQTQTRPFTGYYGPEARLNLMIGVEHGWFGAQDSYDYLWPFIGVQPAWGSLPDLAQRAGWALDYYPGSAPPPPPAPVPAALQSPAPGSTFSSTSTLFSWTAGSGVTAYRLTLGSTVGGTDIYSGLSTNSLSVTVTGLPNDGRAISARLSSLIDGVWRSQDYAFTASTAAPQPVPAALLTPTPGTALASTSQTFTWSRGTGVTSYRVNIGSAPGDSNYYAGAATTSSSVTVSGLPSNGGAIWVQLSSLIGGTWQSTNYNFAAFSSSVVVTVRQTVFVDGTGTVTAPPVSTSIANELIVAFAASSGPGNLSQQLTIAGGGLTWRRAIRANAQAGASEIWWARATAPVSNVRVTSAQSRGGFDQSLTVVTFSGASGIGNVVQANAMDEAPRIAISTSRAGSMVYAVGNDWDGAVARRVPTGQVIVHEWVDTAINDTMWVQTLGKRVTSSGTTVTLSSSQPTSNRWNLAAVEILKQ